MLSAGWAIRVVSVTLATCTSEASAVLVATNRTVVRNSLPGRGGDTVFSSFEQPSNTSMITVAVIMERMNFFIILDCFVFLLKNIYQRLSLARNTRLIP